MVGRAAKMIDGIISQQESYALEPIFDDIIETLMLNLLYSGQLKAMPVRLRSQDERNTVIRPLGYCAEEDIAAYAEEIQFPIIPCDLCGSQDNLQRQVIKDMLQSWDREYPGRLESIFRAVTDVVPSHLLDERLFEFKNLTATPANELPVLNIEQW